MVLIRKNYSKNAHKGAKSADTGDFAERWVIVRV